MPKPSSHELEIVKKIQERISDLDLTEEYLHPKNLVRFVRARDGNLNLIEDMIRKSGEQFNVCYYETTDTETTVRWKSPNNFEEHFPWGIVGFDNLGGPVISFPVGFWNPLAVTGKREEFIRLCLKRFEIVWALLRLKSKDKDCIPQFTVIVDLEGLGWRHLTTYDAIQGVIHMFKTFESNYPDTLRAAIVINEISVFGMLWKLLKPLISDVTHAKISFLGSDKNLLTKSLCQLAKPDQFPKCYGGDQPDNFRVSLKELGVKDFIFQNGNGNNYD